MSPYTSRKKLKAREASNLPRKFCSYPNCGVLLPAGTSHCPAHTRILDERRGTAKERGYDWKWSKAARAFRARWPLCGMKADGTLDTENSWCAKEGRPTIAECVQHIKPHAGPTDPLFMDQTNWLSSCFRCNNRRRALHEPGAFGRPAKP